MQPSPGSSGILFISQTLTPLLAEPFVPLPLYHGSARTVIPMRPRGEQLRNPELFSPSHSQCACVPHLKLEVACYYLHEGHIPQPLSGLLAPAFLSRFGSPYLRPSACASQTTRPTQGPQPSATQPGPQLLDSI